MQGRWESGAGGRKGRKIEQVGMLAVSDKEPVHHSETATLRL